MNENNKKMNLLVGLAEIFNFKFSDTSMMLYLAALKNISSTLLKESIVNGMESNRWQFMPKPGEFLTLGDRAIKNMARESASLCWDAIGRFGRHNPVDASKFMGELAWEVVNRMGGWNQVCESKADDKGIFLAQFRDMSETISLKAERNEMNIKPSLPKTQQNRLIDITKKLSEQLTVQ